MARSRSVALRACAKLNLGLRVLGVRPDGFHEIRSLFHTISLHDSLEVSASRGSAGIRLSVTGDTPVPSGPDNIVWRAARRFLDGAEAEMQVEIRLHKRIPAAAGLGGGSSDAAAVLRALRRIAGTDPGLSSMASGLGSDVPFFLRGGAAMVSGRGEKVEPVAPLRFHAVLVHPDMNVSTRWAYRELDRMRETLTNPCKDNNYCAPAEERHEGKPFPIQLDNDFLPLLVREYGQLRALADFLEGRCQSWGLSGSGPTFYALFESPEEARGFASEVRAYAEGRPEDLGCTVCESADSAGA
jgi:4-diphosphocytidyl-2-C-methyl-D-erythritol kinase